MIKYVIGDATEPIGEGNKIICHICNDENKWGAGFVLAISKKWSAPERKYRKMTPEERQLGVVQLMSVEPKIYVANMIGQHDVKPMKGADNLIIPPIRYDAVLACLRKVAIYAKTLNATVHMPRIGCGLAEGKWETIEKCIDEALKDVNVTVYDLK